MASFQQIVVVVVMLLCCHVHLVQCVVNYIMSSEDSQCPPAGLQMTCSTLQQFTYNTENFSSDSLTLIFQQGWHTLHSELMAINSSEFLMYAESENAWINCDSIGYLNMYNVTRVLISNLTLIGCGENTLQEVNILTICNTIFQGSNDSGAALFLLNSIAKITGSSFVSNTGTYRFPLDDFFYQGDDYKRVGGAIAAYQSQLWITRCTFHGNSAEVGGAAFIEETTMVIISTTFESNFARPRINSKQVSLTGGAVVVHYSSFVSVKDSAFHNSSGLTNLQGVFFVGFYSVILVHRCLFTASKGSVFDVVKSNLTDYNSIYKNNNSTDGAVLNARWYSNMTYINCQFTNNHASFQGGVLYADNYCSFSLKKCDLDHNRALYGGAISIQYSTLYIEESVFHDHVSTIGSGIFAGASNIVLNKTIFYRNSAKDTGALYLAGCNVSFISTAIVNNSANSLDGITRGIVYVVDSTVHSSQYLLISGNFLFEDAIIAYFDKSTCEFNDRFTFFNNSGSFMVMNSHMAFHGYTKLQNCSYLRDYKTVENGGAITIMDSTITFAGMTEMTGNHARRKGGAIHVTGSTVHMSGETLVKNNKADDSGGGVYLSQSKLICLHRCTFSGNKAKKFGGAIHAIASAVYANDEQALDMRMQLDGDKAEHKNSTIMFSGTKETSIIFTGNVAQMGGALAFETNSKLYGSSSYKIIFEFNSAVYGGAIYINDYTNSGTCASRSYLAYSASSECFIQTLNYYNVKRVYVDERHYRFVENYAARSGASLYGGLLDRCTVSPININIKFKYIDNTTSSRVTTPTHPSRVVRNSQEDIQMISSDPVRICFCNDMNPDCNYQWPVIQVMKGHQFKVILVAVDQVNHSVNATIRSFLSSPEGGLGEGQQSQNSYQTCTALRFNAYSPLSSEKLSLYAAGPCNNTGISEQIVILNFAPCTCPIGFQLVKSRSTSCDCTCDPFLYPHIISSCNSTTGLLTRESTAWIGYHRQANHSGYIMYNYCPYDYCYPQTHPVQIDLSIANGTDSQCAFNRAGLLCGTCRPGSSLSLGSTQCISCHKQWLGLLFAIILAEIISGLILVAIIQVFNVTVAMGTLSGILFYANIIAANFGLFIPTTNPNVLTIFIAWLNLDLGFDVCILNGMNAYIKQWLQLAFPTYVIVLVAIIIFISERSSRFAKFIGRGNPVASLATLILLSYTQYLRTVINIFSFAILKYPDSSIKVVWLPDATVEYLSGKHTILFLIALVIVMLGIAYTCLLFAWQWLQLLPKRRFFQWISYTRLVSFMDAYLAPHTPEHRYWTGLLLVARIVLYLVSALNLSNNPRINLLAICLTVSCLFVLKAVLLVKVYRKWLIELVEFSFYFNLLVFTFSSFYSLGDIDTQMAIAHTSTSISLITFLGIILYHLISTVRGARWVKTLKDKATKRNHHSTQTDLLLHDYNNMMSAVVAPTSTVVEISPEHHNIQDAETTVNDEPEISLDVQASPQKDSDVPIAK